ncbi:MAG: L,D-transpeptidase [Hyphomicrobiaceae bacterium]|nr:L,D-transpeptidase [Hyphomicrobiaceae bacterium]
MKISSSRRFFLQGTAALAGFGLTGLSLRALHAKGRGKDGLKPGQFTWNPEASPEGPVAIIVSLPDQRVHVYRNGIRIGVSTCSTGKPGHRTPTGVFTILQKDKHHRSSTYNNAPMPNMNRLTWSGVALHAGHLPGYPASHGCIRLPLKFSELLFSVTHVGTPVIVADDHSEPGIVTHPGPALSALAKEEMDTAVGKLAKKKLPPKKRHEKMEHAVSLIVSRADRTLYIVRDGHVESKNPVEFVHPNKPLGSHTFVLMGSAEKAGALQWKSIGYRQAGAKLHATDASVIGRIQSDPALARKIAGLMHPGLVLVMTDAPAHPETRTKRGFVVAAQDPTWTTQVTPAR